MQLSLNCFYVFMYSPDWELDHNGDRQDKDYGVSYGNGFRVNRGSSSFRNPTQLKIVPTVAQPGEGTRRELAQGRNH